MKGRLKFNRETLSYEVHKTPTKKRLSSGSLIFLLSVVVALGYFYLYSFYFELDSPKLISLKSNNKELTNKLELINKRLEDLNGSLSTLEMRDNSVYRPIFGMEEISSDVRSAGFGGVDRYSYLRNFERSGLLSSTVQGIDVLYKKAYLQSKSFDDLSTLAKSADEMTLCVPAIPPLNIASPKVWCSSSFGYRRDPFTGRYSMHKGIDFASEMGEPIYATGNGTVVRVEFDYFGYGNFILIDHGFGYKTRYAHLKGYEVALGDKVKRGELIGYVGNSGRSTGAHLHYEVIYRDRQVNPFNYYNREIEEEEFFTLINSREE